MTYKILIMGLPGSGKTTLAQELTSLLESKGYSVTWFNADLIRAKYNDWDFSVEGRMRQSSRMKDLADLTTTDYTICDFVAPLQEQRDEFEPDYLIWVDTVTDGKYPDTTAMFIEPTNHDLHVPTQDAENWAIEVFNRINK